MFLLFFQISTIPQLFLNLCWQLLLSASTTAPVTTTICLNRVGAPLWVLSSRSFVISAPISQCERRLKCHSLLHWIWPCTFACSRIAAHTYICTCTHIRSPRSNPNIMSALSAFFCGPAKTKVLTLEEWGGVSIDFCACVCACLIQGNWPDLWTRPESESVKQSRVCWMKSFPFLLCRLVHTTSAQFKNPPKFNFKGKKKILVKVSSLLMRVKWAKQSL